MSDNKPAMTMRLGTLHAAIWRNESKQGSWYNVTLDRRYYDEQADDYKSAASYGRDDLLPLGKLLDMAHTAIHELQMQDRAAAKQASQQANHQSSQQATQQAAQTANAKARVS